MEFNSIAMIETNGLVSAIAALEAMLKLGEINFLKKEIISNGQVTVFVSGNAPNLKRALQASEIAANNIGVVISSSLIENPTKQIMDLIWEEAKNTVKPRKIKKRRGEIKHEKMDTLFDDILEDAIVEESTKVKYDNDIIIEEQKLVINGEVEETEISSNEKNILNKDALIEIENNLELASEEVVNENNKKFESLNHLERLREEAKLEIEKENKTEIKSEEKDSSIKVNLDEDKYSKMNVHELRKLARSNPDFPIKGREISKANRSILIDYLNNI